MQIKTIRISNFRMLKDISVDLQDELTLFIGKNNSGKTSFIVLLEKFLKSEKIGFDDYHVSLRRALLNLSDETKESELTIRLGVEIEYDETDDLSHISTFIHDLDENKNTVNLLFEAKLNKEKLLKQLEKIDDEKKQHYFIKKNLSSYIETTYYIYDDLSMFYDYEMDNFIEKELKDIKKVINLEVIHAKRDVATSNDHNDKNKVISKLTSEYYNEKNKEKNYLEDINDTLLDMDEDLQKNYAETFEELLETTRGFLSETSIQVESNLESESLLKHASRVTYGTNEETKLPENYKGLGYTNLIYLVLNMEIKLLKFANNKANINLFIIEEPEAHTHPQMQSVFIKKLKENILKWINEEKLNLQTIITSHSARIVDHCDFSDLRYFRVTETKKTEISHFVKELSSKYEELYDGDKENELYTSSKALQFIKQYINIHTSELFFTDKIIMIEGITESMLLSYFINQEGSSLNSHNLTVLEVGANAKVFFPLLEFLQVKALIITDIDSTTLTEIKDKKSWVKVTVENNEEYSFTSNDTLRFFYNGAEKMSPEEKNIWFEKLKNQELCQISNDRINVVYQSKEEGYHARSFEDAFLNLNYEEIYNKKDSLSGVKLINTLTERKEVDTLYDLTEKIIEKKSDFAASLLYLALTKEVEWKVPTYIKEGLKWLEE